MRLKLQTPLSLLLSLCLVLAMLSVLSFSKPVHAAAYDRESMSMNGIWDFYPNGGATRHDIVVPSYWDGPDYSGYPSSWATLEHGVYKRSFTIPSSMAGKEIFLSFEQVAPLAKVLVNGTPIATPTNGYLMTRLPYKLNITSVANIGGSNTIEVRVWSYNSFPADAKDASGKSLYPLGVDDLAWGQGRGITDDVELLAYPKVYISDAHIVTDLKNNTNTADDVISVQVTVKNQTASSQTVTVKNNASLAGGSVEKTFADQTVTIPAGGSQLVTLSNVAWTNAKYWWTHDPKLYNLNTSLVQSSTTIDAYTTRFGFRQFSVHTNYYQLNGIKTNLRGDSLQSNWHVKSGAGTALSAKESFKDTNIAQVKMQMDEWKAIYNVARTHIGGAIKEIYEYADEIGLLLIDESPIWQYHNSHSFNTAAMDHVTKWLQQWVIANRNHPSIVIWSGGNENFDHIANNANILIPTTTNAITAVDGTRPIIQDDATTADQENHHYTGGYPDSWMNNSNLYGLYSNNFSKPKGEGEAYTPSQGWAILDASGAYTSANTKDYMNDNLISQAVWHRAADRMVRAIRYAGYADIRYYHNWIYAYEVIEDTIYPTWSDLTAKGIKPTVIDRPMFNAFSSEHPAFIKSDSYEYTKNTFSPVAAFDKDGDKNNRIGVNPPIFTAGSSTTRTIIVYNDEQRDGTSIDVSWEAGYTNPATGAYSSFQTGSFNINVPYGNKAEQTISFTVPADISSRWLQLKLTAKKGATTKFEETNQLGAIGSLPAPKIHVAPVINVGTKTSGNSSQMHKIKLINKGGGLSTNWSVTGQGGWLSLTQASGNLRGEREIYFSIDPTGLAPNTSYSKVLTFTEAGGSSAQTTITFTTGAGSGGGGTPGTILFSDDFESGTATGWTTTSGTWSVMTDGTMAYRQSDTSVANAKAVNGSASWADYEVSAKVKAASFAGSLSGIGIDARYQDASNKYTFSYSTNGNILKIQRTAGGTSTDLVTKAYTFNTGAWYTFKAVMNGNTLEFWVNGVLELTTTDSTYATGMIGLFSHRADTRFDDVTVSTLSSAGSTLLSDNFESGSAAGWTTTSGTWAVMTDGTQVYQQSDNSVPNAKAVSGSAAWTDYEVSAQVKAQSFGSAYAGIGLDARYQDASNKYTFSYSTNGNILKIQRTAGGTSTDLVTKAYTFNTGTWYTFKAVVSGNTLEFWVNGVKELTVTDSTFSTGMIGLFSHRADTRFDEVSVLSL
ncbi:family 16 glycoside hydrolase [Paenibacillus sp. PL2-23]|uniref:family 16 glycoside hydrolase n=1 Tax=Paenibacillus sp. PL2-23 TaxID=2100729 RepID=UPI0030FA8B81